MKEVIRKPIPIALSSEYMDQLTNENGGGRKYEVYGETYTSVTSVINNTLRNFGVEKWKSNWVDSQLTQFNGRKLTKSLAAEIVTASDHEMQRSGTIGTHMHNIIERLLRDEDINDVPKQLEPAVRAWLKWRRQFIEWELVGTEVGVWHPDMFAGQVDALFRNGNDYLIVDWKTTSGLYDSSFLQAAAYAKALQTMYMVEHGIQTNLVQAQSVKACVVRLVNDYPRIHCSNPQHYPPSGDRHTDKCRHGKKNRRVDKIFTDQCEYVMVDVPTWYETFSHVLAVHRGRSARVGRVKL